jgi:hypothetical protein
MIEKLKNIIGNRILSKAAKVKRDKAFMNMENIRTLGILYEYSEQENAIAEKLMNFFIAKRVNVLALAFENTKHKEDNVNDVITRPIPPAYQKIFTKSDLTWYNKPDCEIVKNFISKKFDVLIDISRNPSFVFKYISTMSRAKCKIGGVQYKNDPFDLILLEKSKDLSKFIDLIISFLSTIKIEDDVRK